MEGVTSFVGGLDNEGVPLAPSSYAPVHLTLKISMSNVNVSTPDVWSFVDKFVMSFLALSCSNESSNHDITD